jgi:hypothetical protein
MPKFRKKPLEVDAEQFFPEKKHPEGVETAPGGNYFYVRDKFSGQNLTVRRGDWVVRGTQGEHYPVDPKVFGELYEPVGGPKADKAAPKKPPVRERADVADSGGDVGAGEASEEEKPDEASPAAPSAAKPARKTTKKAARGGGRKK